MADVSLNIGADIVSIPHQEPPQPNASSAESGNSGHKEPREVNRRGAESGNSGREELQEANRGGTENSNTGNQTLIGHIENTTPSSVGPTDDETHFDLFSQELFVFRWTLRILSLWCPTSACFVERLIYPALVSLLLLLIIGVDSYMLAKGAWKSLDVYVYLAIDGGMYSSHLLGLLYFRSNDLEENMLGEINLNYRLATRLRKKLTRLKVGIILSYLLLVVLVLLFFNTEVWLRGRFQCNSSFKFLHGFASHFVCYLNYPANIYGVGNSLALSWTMCLLQQICYARLKQLHRKYLRWTGTAEEAVYEHLTNYSRKIKKTCGKLKVWFVAHNLILIFATPFLCTDIIDGFKAIRKSNAVHTGLFVGFLVYTIVIWVAPLYFAEQLQNHDEKLCTRVNEFCPGTFRAKLEHEGHAHLSNQSDAANPNQACNYTLHSRAEVNKFLSYLKNRKSGFLMGSYSFQLKLSMLSVFLAIFAFAARTVG